MWPPFDFFEHRRICAAKQQQREDRFASLPAAYRGPLTAEQREILNRPIASLVHDVQNNITSPIDILRAYGKTTILTQKRTNAVTELLLPEAEEWATNGVNLKGPLAGIPVSLKDSIAVGGYDVSVGYTRHCFKPYPEDGIMVKLLKRAGAVPHIKTALPITLLSFESSNALWGVSRNPHNPKYSPGGSSGGEGAVLAAGASRIGIGSDVAGSVRAPAAWSGTYSLRCSVGRWPKVGSNTSMPGQEGVLAVFSPMARTLDDLTYFVKSLIGMKPWEVDYSVHPIPWREQTYDDLSEKKQGLRVGVMMSDGVCPPSPAIKRAMNLTVSALERAGHQVIQVPVQSLPSTASPLYGLQIASVLLNADGGKTFHRFFHSFEPNDPSGAQILFYQSLPRPVKYLWYLWTRYVKRDPVWASLLRYFHPLTANENWQWVAKREAYRGSWFEWWSAPQQNFDFILCPANATPALPHGAMKDAMSSCGYTFLWNLLDYSAGVIPVTKVDPVHDALSPGWKPSNGVEKGAYKHYDAEAMKGLPCAVQVVTRRLQEENALACMKVVDDALKADGVIYELMDIEAVVAHEGDT